MLSLPSIIFTQCKPVFYHSVKPGDGLLKPPDAYGTAGAQVSWLGVMTVTSPLSQISYCPVST